MIESMRIWRQNFEMVSDISPQLNQKEEVVLHVSEYEESQSMIQFKTITENITN
jgi:predicted transcriptional regulator